MIPWRDTEMEEILPDFDVCFGFIDKARDGQGACLVHCSDGVSRSGAVCIAYMILNQKMSLKVLTKREKRRERERERERERGERTKNSEEEEEEEEEE